MQHAKEKKKLTKIKYSIMGFLHALQVWAYESIPTITRCSVDKVNDDAIPRMLRWVCQQSPKSNTIQSQVFDSPMGDEGDHMGFEGDHMGFEGLVDHTLQNEEVDVQTQDIDTIDTPPWRHMGFKGLVDYTLQNEEVDVQTQDVDTIGTSPWLRMPKKDDTNNGVKVGNKHQMNALGI
ncbi:ubiquitin-like-specific protease ESD4 isoform X2 [Cucumis melo var. makuwa]|uniref:Ubiquitin-like-specific protease ESD4 isoform X2 n=1 Tax=Cucumis melo var. makuwa TaxID=1194695 RepID=A0A5A7UVX3_CUCMM|nr:ubiquitin-like-specific protease ESD4 isoform X2 [Cucumis melo var. makuwa]